MKPNVVSADVLFEVFRERLGWQWVAGLGASERRFDEVAVRAARSGADLVGYLNYIHPYRLQMLGEREVRYLTRGTPEDCARRINRIVTQVQQAPGMRNRMEVLSLEPRVLSPTQFAELVRADYERWGQAIRASGFKAVE